MPAAAQVRLAVPPLIDPRALAGIDPAARIADLSGETMGTGWRVRIAAAPELDLAPVREAITACLDAIVAQMSHWSDNSLLSQFNRAAAGSWTSLPRGFARVIETGLDIAERSDGAFDPAIGRLTDLYGLGPNPIDALPTDQALTKASAAPGWQRLAYDPQASRLRQPGGLWLDLSGIAKGHAVDAVADLLGGMGLRHALVEIGGECAGRGIRPDGDPWWVALESPPGLDIAPLRVALHQLAVATSGNYVRGDHNLDPRTGRPARDGVLSVSVLHDSAMSADAWATALTVLGLDDGAALARREGLAVRIITAIDGERLEWFSPRLEQMLED